MQTMERAARHLIFQLGDAEYGVDVMVVKEIVGMQRMTPVPHAAHDVKGVINLRGKVVPVVDLRAKLGLPEAMVTLKSSLVVVRTQQSGDEVTMAVHVDAVSEVAQLDRSDMRLLDLDALLRTGTEAR